MANVFCAGLPALQRNQPQGTQRSQGNSHGTLPLRSLRSLRLNHRPRIRESAGHSETDAERKPSRPPRLRVMLASNLPAFHRWFLAPRAAAPGIVLHGFPELPIGLASALAQHLNEFDDDAGGNWTAFSPELIKVISETPPQRSLLGLEEGCKNCPPNSPCGRRKVFGALARRGHAVLD